MFRKFVLALGATAVIGSAALIPTSASAHHHHGHRFWGGPALILAAPSCYTVKQKVLTPIGWQIRYVEVCD